MNWNDLQKGFYYHYKHDDSKGIRDYVYEVIGIGHHTEIDDLESGAFVIYRPLYESAKVFKAGGHYYVRPFNMFVEDVTKDGKKFKRFTKIEDQKIVAELEKIRDQMYSK